MTTFHYGRDGDEIRSAVEQCVFSESGIDCGPAEGDLSIEARRCRAWHYANADLFAMTTWRNLERSVRAGEAAVRAKRNPGPGETDVPADIFRRPVVEAGSGR